MTLYGWPLAALGALASFGAAAAILVALGPSAMAARREGGAEVFETALAALPNALAVTTATGKTLWTNAAFKSAVGELGQEADLAGLGALSPSLGAAIYRLLSAAAKGRECAEAVALSRKDGVETLTLSARPLRAAAFGPLNLLWELKRRQETKAEVLRQTRAAEAAKGARRAETPGAARTAFGALLKESQVAAALLGRAGAIVCANGGFGALLSGKDTKAAKTLGDLVATEAATPELSAYFSPSAAGKRAPLELIATAKAKAELKVRLSLSPAGDGEHVLAIVTEAGAPALDEQTVQSQKLQAVGELAGGIAHDFNNLLTAIIGLSDLLLQRFRASDPAFKDIIKIKSNATRAAHLVQQILAYSRRQTLRPTILTLTDVVQEFQVNIGRTLRENIKLNIQHGRDLWFVKADETQLLQVVLNLALNARDAMPQGGELTIRTANVSDRESLIYTDRGLKRGEYVLCEVADTGTGIHPDHLKKIFDPFFSTKEIGKGTGLGLSMVHGIVQQTGGAIFVDSQLGKGTSFKIFLPRYLETEEDLKALRQARETREKVADLTGSATVLLVEDEDAVRSFASRALSTRGYKVLEAASGVEALEVMERQEGKIDIVVSDVVMPEMDGPTLLRHLRKQKPDIKVIFMSGYAEEAFRKNLGGEEEFVFLPKPFTLKKLAETVKLAAA